jgi:hypothetical protein
MLQKKYQPALRKGIKIAVDLVNTVDKDNQDGDVEPASDEMGALLKGKKIGNTINHEEKQFL